MTHLLLHVIAAILARFLQYISTLTLLLRRNVFTPYSYTDLGLYSHFIALIMYRLEEEVKGIFFLGTVPHIDLEVILQLPLQGKKKKEREKFFSSGAKKPSWEDN